MAEHGYIPYRALVTNGGAESLLWRQVTADVLGLPLELVAHHTGSSLGAAFVAGMGVGVFTEWQEIDKFIEIENVTQPNLENHKRYQELFLIYREIYENLKDTYPKLARATTSY